MGEKYNFEHPASFGVLIGASILDGLWHLLAADQAVWITLASIPLTPFFALGLVVMGRDLIDGLDMKGWPLIVFAAVITTSILTPYLMDIQGRYHDILLAAGYLYAGVLENRALGGQEEAFVYPEM